MTTLQQRFTSAIKQQSRIRIPAFMYDGNEVKPFYSDIVKHNSGNAMVCDNGIAVHYDFVTGEEGGDELINTACNLRGSDVTIFIHAQFLDEGMSDSQLDFIARDGAYQSRVDGEMKVIEVYSVACINGACQYRDYVYR